MPCHCQCPGSTLIIRRSILLSVPGEPDSSPSELSTASSGWISGSIAVLDSCRRLAAPMCWIFGISRTWRPDNTLIVYLTTRPSISSPHYRRQFTAGDGTVACRSYVFGPGQRATFKSKVHFTTHLANSSCDVQLLLLSNCRRVVPHAALKCDDS
jgi:hypothetical protein